MHGVARIWLNKEIREVREELNRGPAAQENIRTTS
jgi:hypothetical protein